MAVMYASLPLDLTGRAWRNKNMKRRMVETRMKEYVEETKGERL